MPRTPAGDRNGHARASVPLASAVRVIVVSSRLTPYDIHRMMRLGVKCFIHREDLAESLLASLDLVRRQVVTLSPRASNLFASQSYLNPLGHLNPLDMQVLRMMAHDFNVKTIASALEVSLRSVYRARERLREILGVSTNEGLVNTARELGLLAAVAIDRDGNGQDDETLSYQQNANGQRTRLTLPGDLAVTSTYDVRGRLAQVTDWSNQQVALSYDRVGRLKRIDRPGEIDTTLTYDAAGGLTMLRHEAGASLLAQFDYTLNGRGHRTQAVEQMRRVNGTVQTRTLTYAYDALARLTESITPEGAYTYGYDLSGGRLSEGYGGVTRTFSYNAANQLISDGVHTYTYDPRGNLLTKMQGATVIETSSYDRANRLLNVDGTSYGYDGDGQRIRQTVGGTVTEYLVDAAAGLPVVVQATRGAAVTRNVHAVGGVLSEQNPDGTWEWLLRDGLGSVRSVTDAAGAVLETVDYSPYGVANAALTRTAYGFTGEMIDTNGRVYLRARYYHPTLGTFPTLDPFEGAPERPLSLHGYSWVEGNVVNSTDPTGEQCEGSPNPQKMFAACGGGGGGGLGMLLITALTVAASYMVYRNAVCLADEALDLGLGLASESLLPWNISPLSEQVIQNLSQEDDLTNTQSDDDTLPIPIPRPRDFDQCQKTWDNCDKVEGEGGRFFSFEDAIDEIERVKQINIFEDQSERDFTYGSHCPRIGTHSHFYNTPSYDDQYVASVTCCPCCNTDYGMPLPDVRCFVKYSRT